MNSNVSSASANATTKMYGYLFYEEFTSNGFRNAVVSILWFSVAQLVLAAILHGFVFCRLGGTGNGNRMIVSRDLKRDTLVYFAFLFILAILTATFSVRFDVQRSIHDCSVSFSVITCSYTFSNFLLYRLLIAKSRLYDPMSRFKVLSRITWWLIHGVYFPVQVIISIGEIAGENSRLFENVNGDIVCVEWLTVNWIAIYCALDTIVSILCIVLLAAPPMLTLVDRELFIVVVRNVLSMMVAISSTFMMYYFLLFASRNVERGDGRVHPEHDRFIVVDIVLDLGVLDIFINLTCVIFSWPFQFYWKSVKDIWIMLASEAISSGVEGNIHVDLSGIPRMRPGGGGRPITLERSSSAPRRLNLRQISATSQISLTDSSITGGRSQIRMKKYGTEHRQRRQLTESDMAFFKESQSNSTTLNPNTKNINDSKLEENSHFLNPKIQVKKNDSTDPSGP